MPEHGSRYAEKLYMNSGTRHHRLCHHRLQFGLPSLNALVDR
jgi:hypothetical protein